MVGIGSCILKLGRYMWRFEICEDWNKIQNKEYQNRWLDLLDQSPTAHVFFHPSLVKAWMETYFPLRNIKPIFVWGYNDSNVVFFPLVYWKKNWKNAFLRSIVPAGYSDFDYHDPIFKNEVEIDELRKFWDELTHLLNQTYKTDSIIIEGIRTRFCIPLDQFERGEVCPCLELGDITNEDDLMKFFKSSLRGDIRRQIRRINEIGEVTLKTYNSYDDAKSAFCNFIKAHSIKWPNAYKAPDFHDNLIKNIADGIIHFTSLNMGNTPIAWHLGFNYKGVYYYYMPVGNSEFNVFSPVKIHLYYLLKRAIDLRFVKYDHLRGDETYKGGWANDCDYVHTMSTYSNTIESQLKLFLVNKVKPKL